MDYRTYKKRTEQMLASINLKRAAIHVAIDQGDSILARQFIGDLWALEAGLVTEAEQLVRALVVFEQEAA